MSRTVALCCVICSVYFCGSAATDEKTVECARISCTNTVQKTVLLGCFDLLTEELQEFVFKKASEYLSKDIKTKEELADALCEDPERGIEVTEQIVKDLEEKSDNTAVESASVRALKICRNAVHGMCRLVITILNLGNCKPLL